MISDRKSLKYFLERDRIALGRKRHRPKLFGDEVWKFQRALRRLEFLQNGHANVFERTFIRPFVKFLYHRLSVACCFSIPCNTFGPGLSIAHRGTIVVNSRARIGENCRIHIDTNIGASGGNPEAPRLGDRVYIAPGAKIFGDIVIGDDVAIGANSVVNKSFLEGGVTIAGVPAKIVSSKSSAALLQAA